MRQIAAKLLKMSHLCLFTLLLVITQYVRVIELTPLCGRSGGSSSSPSLEAKNTDKIYFLDQQQDIRTVEINGTIVTCFDDGTIINATSAAPASKSNSNGLQTRIENGKFKFRNEVPNSRIWKMLQSV